MIESEPLPLFAARCAASYARAGDSRSRGELLRRSLAGEADLGEHLRLAERRRAIALTERPERFARCAAEWRRRPRLSDKAIRAILTLRCRELADANPGAVSWTRLRGPELARLPAAIAAWEAECAPAWAAHAFAGGTYRLGGPASSGGPAVFRVLHRLGIVDYNHKLTAGGSRLAETIAAALGIASLGAMPPAPRPAHL